MNDLNIPQLLSLVDDDSTITELSIKDNTKYITITKNGSAPYCPECRSRLHSKGWFTNHPNHQIFQDGSKLVLTLKGRRWKCPNPNCTNTTPIQDKFKFIGYHKKVTSIIILQILNEMKDINLSAKQIASHYKVSDTYVHQIFMKHIHLKRLPLTEYLCIDEVHLNLSDDCKCAIVIMDFLTGNIIDILPSRRQKYTEEYFLSIPKDERDKVKYLVSDMYNPYINYTNKYFTNAKSIVDSFHVLQWLLRLINDYINKVKKKYQQRDHEKLIEENKFRNVEFEKRKDSKEVYILKNADWVLLKNRKNWFISKDKFNTFLGRTMNTLTWEEEFLKLDDKFRLIRDLKDEYEEFNESFINDLKGAEDKLNSLIDKYSASSISIFREFSILLKKYKT